MRGASVHACARTSMLRGAAQVRQDTLVLWGRNDEILEPSYAQKFQEALPGCTLAWVEQCGHCPHLEQPALTAQRVFEFVGMPVQAETVTITA